MEIRKVKLEDLESQLKDDDFLDPDNGNILVIGSDQNTMEIVLLLNFERTHYDTDDAYVWSYTDTIGDETVGVCTDHLLEFVRSQLI